MFLVTGFEPFISKKGIELEENPTAQMAVQIANQHALTDAYTLPVSFARTRAVFNELLAKRKPRYWLGLGFAPHRTDVDIETVALNLEHCLRPDNDGDTPYMRTCIEGAPLAYRSSLFPELFQRSFSALGVDAKVSTHAGTFLCNQTFFNGCHATENAQSLIGAGFIHIPPLADYTRVVSAIVKTLEAIESQR